MGGVEERAASSLSMTSSKGSRIPRLSRSGSLREKNHRSSLDSPTITRSSINERGKQMQKNPPQSGGLYRSSSFATSRGMSDISSSASCGRSTTPLTPELKRRKFPILTNSYVSPYSRKAIAAERKSQSHVGVPSSREREVHSYYSPQISRRSSLPPVTSHLMTSHSPHCAGGSISRGDITPEEDDDDISEKSFGSVSSAHSCDVGGGMKRLGSGFWGTGRRPRNILHCTHAHVQDPDDYLTPTQRAARKIRELQSELKRAKREIFEKDTKISVLTRDLVELRMNKAGNEENESKPNKINENDGKNEQNIKRKGKESMTLLNSREEGSPPLSFFPPCLTPTSEDSERELKILTGENESKGASEISSSKGSDQNSSPRDSPAEASVGGDSDSGDLSRSLADSGHYEDLPSPCMSSRDSLDAGFPSIRKIISSIFFAEGGERDNAMIWSAVGAAEGGLRAEWARRIEELKGNHMEEYHEMKERHNDKVEMLLSKLSDANLKYFELRPQYDKAQERVRELEKEVVRLKDELRDSEIRHQKVYLQMYLKGQQAAKLEAEDKFHDSPPPNHSQEESRRRLSAKEVLEREGQTHTNMIFSLMKQLAQSEDEIQRLKVLYNQETNRNGRGRTAFANRREEIDPEITLQFLKSAIYYFLTDRENAQGHLRAIESILGYSSIERGNISRNSRI